jgi:tetratricopeptide (TPR) repeat protein
VYFSAHVTSANDLAQAWYVRAKIYWKRGDFDDATQFTRRAAIVFELLGDPRRLAFTHILEASIAFEQGDPARARDLLRNVFAPLKRSGDKRALAAAALSLGNAEGQLGNIREAKRWIGSAALAFERMRVKPELIRARWSLGYYMGLHGSRKEGLDLMRGAQSAFQELRMPLDAGFVSLDLADVLLLVPGSAREVEQTCRSAYDLFIKAGARPAAEKALAYLRVAATDRRANQPLVESVRKYLRLLERDPSAEFRPNEPAP